MTTYSVLGEPCGKGRPRFNRASGRVFTPAKTRAWEQTAAAEFAYQHGLHQPFNAPLAAVIVAVFARPKGLDCSHKRQPCSCADDWRGRQPHIGKPDLDNIAKAVGDALQFGGVVADDSRIVEMMARKTYGAVGEQPRVEVTVEEWRKP